MLNFAYSQADVTELCRDRKLETAERHPENDFYGQASVLKRYSGLPIDKPLAFVVEHGLRFDAGVWSRDAESPLVTFAASSESRAALLQKATNKVVVPIGFGSLYARNLVELEMGFAPQQRVGTLVFPPHSTHHIEAVFDHGEFARSLAALDEEFQPIYVCGYWKDVLSGALVPYQLQGLPLVTCGHMFDPDFLLRLYDLCRRFRYATSREIGTHLFVAVSSGCRFFYSDWLEAQYHIPVELRGSSPTMDHARQADIELSRRLFAAPVSCITPEQQHFVDDRIGSRCMLTPEALRSFARDSAARQRKSDIQRKIRNLASWTKLRTAARLPAGTMHRSLVNLGCGTRRHPDWTNADMVPAGPDVLAVDLRKRLPFADATLDAVYASHVLEHLTPLEARLLLGEMRRVLRPGGVVRIVVPDLEAIVRGYLRTLDEVVESGDEQARWRHRWMTVELLDQMVRTQSGGAMSRWWSCDPVPCLDLIEERFGAEATKAITSRPSRTDRRPLDPAEILFTPPVSDREALAFAACGERHKWMYDRVSLADALRDAGFAEPRQTTAIDSQIPAFATYELDADASGRVHKPDSLFMEAIRPGA